MTRHEHEPQYELVMLILAFVAAITFIILFTGCTTDEATYCYECHNRAMPSVTYCGYTEADIQRTQEWWAYYLNDTLYCNVINIEP